MKTVLVTGAGGYIGSNATYLLLQKGYNVVAVDSLVTGYEDPITLLKEKFGTTESGQDRLTFYKRDLESDLNDIFIAHTIDAVLHYAAPCNVDESMKHPEKYFKTIRVGSNLLDTMESHGVKTIVFSSTCAVYGEAEYVPVDEKHPTKPVNPYGESKRMVEIMVDWYAKIKDFHYVVLRYFNVCGASDDGLIGDSKKPSRHLMQNAVRGALNIEPFMMTCPEVETPDKTPIRDYTNVNDLNNAHILALEYLWNGGANETINLGTGTGNSVKEIVTEVQKLTGATFDLKSGEARKGEYATMVADISKAQEVLKWKPEHTLEQSVQSLVTWYTAHPHGWDK